MIDLAKLETKLAAARTRLILEKPFLGSLVMHLPLKAADAQWCKTTATDARHFFFNPSYIARLTLEQTQFVLAHEAMHCALSHFARRAHRQKHRWDVACDYAVNMILDEERMQPPENALMSATYRGLTAEEIYPLLHEDPPEETQDTHLFDNSSSEGSEGSPEEQEQDGRGQENESDSEERNEAGSPETSEGGEGESRQASEGDRPPPPPADPDKLDEQWKGRLAAAAQAGESRVG